MRTLPLYLVAFLLLLIPTLDPNDKVRTWSYALLVQNLYLSMPSNWFGISWSLTIEEWSYLALPAIAFLVFRRNILIAAAILIAAGFGARVYVALTHDLSTIGQWDLFIRKTVVCRSDAIAYGLLAAVVARRVPVLPVWTLIFSVSLVSLSVWICFDVQNIHGVVGWLLLLPITSAGFGLLIPWLSRVPDPAWGKAPVQFLARISYALYLFHWPFLFVVQDWVIEGIRTIVFAGGTTVTATIASYGIEQPIMRLRPDATHRGSLI